MRRQLPATLALGGVLISSLRISAFLCASAVTAFTYTFTAETQRNAEVRREDFKLGHYLSPVMGRNQEPPAKQGELLGVITSLDQAFFEAYNKCELSKIESLFTDDVEFYHEKRGQLIGRKGVMEAISKNLCGDKSNRVRRELVEGTLQVYAIDNYGALAVGEHRFYLTQAGQKEKLDGIGRFANLWQLKDGEWRMSRVFSYGFRSP